MTERDRKRAAEALTANWDDHEAVRDAVRKLQSTDAPELVQLHDLYSRRLQELALSVQEKYVLGFAFYKAESGSQIGDRVVLVRKKRPQWQAGCLNGLGGKVEARETANEAMTREFQQESGVHVPEATWSYFATLEWPKAKVNCYTVDLTETQTVCTRTDEEVVTVTVADALAGRTGLVMNSRWLIPLALDKTAQPVTVRLR